MVDDKYWQLLKRSLADQHRQYLEEVTEPMSLGFDAPEEFVTSKPSIYHSLRMQPATDARTGQVRSSPAKARTLANMENLNFQNAMHNFSLPLSTNQGESLYGRHVYPSELYTFNPNFKLKTTPDLPTSYKMTHGAGDLYRPLNLYGFTGNAPTPQRFTDKTLQPEGILYDNLDENDVVQLNRKPTTAYSLAQVARALSPFHESMDVTRLGENQQELAGDIMEAGIPPILAESNVDTTGRTHALPFRIDEVSDVQEAHDPFVQWRPDSLMTSSPEGLEQFTLDNLRRSEPMDLAMQLLKEEAPYGSRDYPSQEIAVSTGTPLMGSKNSGPTPEVCNMPGCESGLPPVVYRRMANPIRSIDNHEFMCEQCAYKNDMQSLLYHKMLKGEITLAEFTMRLLKEEPLYLQGSNTLARRAREELETDKTGQNSPAYQEMLERLDDIYYPQDASISLEDNLDQYAQETGKNPWRSLPGREMPNKHGGTAKVHLAPITPIHPQPFYDWQAKNASEPMEIAMRLLKNEPVDYGDTYHRVRNNISADGEYMTDEELNAINERYSELHDDESHLEEYYNLLEAIELEKKRRAEESFDGIGLNEETGFTRSEPMEIAMRLLKERVSPEAKQHKLEYDKKYESSPERVKYREELNRERRRRHIMGQGGPDMSHTKDHTIVPEDSHTNRARHFKDKGTLL